MAGASPDGRERGRLSQAISDSMTELVKQGLGRGPLRIQTYIHQQAVICLLYGTMTDVERTLASNGSRQLVYEIREGLHSILREQAIHRIEDITGRKVAGYLTDHDPGPDCGTFVFVLGPADGAKSAGASEP